MESKRAVRSQDRKVQKQRGDWGNKGKVEKVRGREEERQGEREKGGRKGKGSKKLNFRRRRELGR